MIYFLLPAYNEESDIGRLLERIQAAMVEIEQEYRVLIVNDGSTDGTVAVANRYTGKIPVEILSHPVNQGLGMAMLTGLRRGSELAGDQDIVVSMDADNTHDPCLTGRLLAKVRAGADLVIASRYELGGKEVGLPRLRSLFSRGASTLLKIFFPIEGAKDYTCGYRAYKGELLHRAFAVYGDQLVEERGFTCMAEILIKMWALSAKITEVPLVLRYDLKSSPSKIKVIQTIIRYFYLIAHNISNRPAALQRGVTS